MPLLLSLYSSHRHHGGGGGVSVVVDGLPLQEREAEMLTVRKRAVKNMSGRGPPEKYFREYHSAERGGLSAGFDMLLTSCNGR